MSHDADESAARAEEAFVRGEYSRALALCRPVLEACVADLSAAATVKIEVEPHARQEVLARSRLCAVHLQSVFEQREVSGEEEPGWLAGELLLLERFLKQCGPQPFELVFAWLNLRGPALGHYSYCKELLEALLGRQAERVKRGGVATPEMCRQYALLAHLYAATTLPRLGESEAAHKFLAMHSNSALLPRERRQALLVALSEEMAARERADKLTAPAATAAASPVAAAAPAAAPAAATAAAAAALAAADSPSAPATPMRQPAGSAGQAAEARSSRRKERRAAAAGKDDVAIVLTREQAGYLAAGAVALAVVLTQRQRIRAAASASASFIGTVLFSGT
jgi:hypothetical protein